MERVPLPEAAADGLPAADELLLLLPLPHAARAMLAVLRATIESTTLDLATCELLSRGLR